MYLVSWVELDQILNYHPKYEIAETYNEAKEIQSKVEERFDSQEVDPNNLESGKICSDAIVIEEVDYEKVLKPLNFQTDEKLLCPKCNKPAERIIAITSVEVSMFWNDEEGYYDVIDDSYNIEDANVLQCCSCLGYF